MTGKDFLDSTFRITLRITLNNRITHTRIHECYRVDVAVLYTFFTFMVNVSEISMRGEQRGIEIYFITEDRGLHSPRGPLSLRLQVSWSLFHDFPESNFSYKSDPFDYLSTHYLFIVREPISSISKICAIYIQEVTRLYGLSQYIT